MSQALFLEKEYMKGDIKGDILRLRIQAGLSQQQLADKMRVNRAAIIKWEKGTTYPRARNLRKLCNILGDIIPPKGINEAHINNMKVEKTEKAEPDDDWYKKTIDSLIHINGEGYREFRESKKEEIEELKLDKVRLHEHVDKLITRVNPPNNT